MTNATYTTIKNELEKLEAKRANLQLEFNKPNADFKLLGTQEDLIDDAISALINVKSTIEENETIAQEDLMNILA